MFAARSANGDQGPGVGVIGDGRPGQTKRKRDEDGKGEDGA